MKKTIFISLLTVLVLGNVFIVVSMVSSGAKVSELEKEKLSLLKVNQEVRDSLVKVSSLADLEKKAANLSYLKPSEKLYLNEINTVAIAQ